MRLEVVHCDPLPLTPDLDGEELWAALYHSVQPHEGLSQGGQLLPFSNTDQLDRCQVCRYLHGGLAAAVPCWDGLVGG